MHASYEATSDDATRERTPVRNAEESTRRRDQEATGKPVEEEKTERVHTGLVSRAEQRALRWLVPRVPSWIGPDGLTFLGLGAMAVAGLCYYLTSFNRLFLLGASAALVVNWFGDSLDGALARHRQRPRPKYGYYLDHLVDGYGVAFILVGLAFSGVASPVVCYVGLAVYLILCINTYLAAHTVRVFKLSYGGISATEGRILLVLFNTVVMLWPTVTVFGVELLSYDIPLALFTIFLTVLTIRSASLCLAQLDEQERAAWPEHAPTGPVRAVGHAKNPRRRAA